MEVTPVQIIDQPHPLIASAGRKFAAQEWRAGETARAALLRAGLDPHTEISIIINDRRLTVEEWDSVCPSPGDIVHAVAAVSGGGGEGGSSPLKVVLMLAIVVASFVLGPEVGAFMGGFDSTAAMGAAGAVGNLGLSGAAWGAIGSGVIALAGNIVVGALFKPSTGSLSKVNGASDSPTYSLSGGSNSLRPYGPMQVVMGKHRVFPDYGAKPFTQYQGLDQYLYQIFHFGISAVAITDMRIGDSPLSNYADFGVYWQDANGALPQFPNNVDSESGGTLVKGANWITRTSAQDTITLAVDVEGVVFYANGKTKELVECTARVEVQYCPTGTNAWTPMTYGEAVTYTTGHWSLQTIETVWYEEYPQYVEWGFKGYAQRPVQHAFAKDGHYEGEVEQIPMGPSDLSPIYGTWHWVSFDAGFQSDGPQPIYTTVPYVDIPHGASQSPQRRTFSLGVPKGVYDVRVRLTSVRNYLYEINDGDTNGSYSYAWSTLRSYQADTALYAGQTRMGLVIRASGQISGIVQRLSALASAYCHCYVDGAWRWQPTSNPAWWYLDFARGRKNSAGKQMYGCHLTDAQIDVAGIIAWAAFCENEALSCNLVVDSQQSASDTLADVARCGLASPSWASGKLGVVWDARNASPVAAFGMSNIIRGSFSVRYATENLADEIIVSYVDAALDWTQQQMRVTVPGVTNPQRASTLEIKGCTSRWLAGKLANIQAAAQAYRKRTITWDTDMEGFVCQRGDVVLLQHDLTQWGYSGRLLGVAGSVITLDRKVPRSGATEYVMLVSPDGTMQTWAISPGTGEADTLVLPSTPTLQADMLELDHRWFFSPLPTPGKRVKIVSVKPVSQYRMQIVATDDDPELYAAWDGTWAVPVKQTLLREMGIVSDIAANPPPPVIADMTVGEMLIVEGVDVVNKVTLTFTVTGGYTSIYVEYRIAGSPWYSATLLHTLTLEFFTALSGPLEVRANAHGARSMGPRYNGRGLIVGTSAPPDDVVGFVISVSGSQAFLSYEPTDELDVKYGGRFIVRHSSMTTGATWDSSSYLIDSVPGAPIVAPLLAGTYLAKWADSGGRESRNASLIVSTRTAELDALNFVASLSDGPSWSGALSSVVLDPTMGGVKLDSSVALDSVDDLIDSWAPIDTIGGIVSDGTYTFAASLDLGQVATSRLTNALDILTFSATDLVDSWDMVDSRPDMDGGGDPVDGRVDNIDSWLDLDGIELSSAKAYFEISISDDMLVWSAWQTFRAGEWSFRGIRARVKLHSDLAYINIVVRSASLTVDMPDRIESDNDLIASGGTYSVAYLTPFQIAPALAIAAQGLSSGDYYEISGKTASGFTITFKNSSGTPVVRTFDYISKGY